MFLMINRDMQVLWYQGQIQVSADRSEDPISMEQSWTSKSALYRIRWKLVRQLLSNHGHMVIKSVGIWVWASFLYYREKGELW